MNSGKSTAALTADAELGLQAVEWLLRISDSELDPSEPYATIEARNKAFLDWIVRSADHLRIFLETVATHRQLSVMEPQQLKDVEILISQRSAEVIRLYGSDGKTSSKQQAPGKITEISKHGTVRWFVGLAASVGILGLAVLIYALALDRTSYSTAVGEQRSAKLQDGSFIYLNTDSRVEVEFSDNARHLRLLRGEALFVVERDSRRPFIVTSGNTTVQAIGTQFNVRHVTHGTEVAVIEGVVQVSERNDDAAAAPVRLQAGEQTRITAGRVAPQITTAATDALAWRQRRLVFHDARLAQVAAEFNRYNHTKVRVEGESAQDILLTGIFDADRPEVLMLYAARNSGLKVEPDGSDWVIRGR